MSKEERRERRKVWDRKYNEANKEKIAAHNKAYNEANKEKRKAQQAINIFTVAFFSLLKKIISLKKKKIAKK